MKNFDDILNIVGTFPTATAQDCSGPGETDGTAVDANTMTDSFGWIQALLNGFGATPSDVAESTSISQILEAIKLLPPIEYKHLTEIYPNASDWTYLDAVYWESSVNDGILYVPFNVPSGITDLDVEVVLTINPGAARTGTNRIGAIIQQQLWSASAFSSYADIGTYTYDNAGTDVQSLSITLNLTGSTTSFGLYRVKIKAGNTGAANVDRLYHVRIIKTRT